MSSMTNANQYGFIHDESLSNLKTTKDTWPFAPFWSFWPQPNALRCYTIGWLKQKDVKTGRMEMFE